MNAGFKQVKEIFLAALERQSPDARESYLSEACAGDESLRRQVEALLHKHEQAGSFLESPPVDPASHTATVDSPVTERPGTVIGPYKLMEQIGEGGMGLVFIAEQHEPVRRKVALKLIKPGMDSREIIARFQAERQALALMDHPNIARVLDAGATPSGRPYFVMELVKGVPITQFCDDNRLSSRERLELFTHVCHAVQHAHQKGIIHRDIKPTNVLVTSHDGRPVVKVIDFGVAKAIGQQLTERTIYTAMTQMVGTPLYMSPEQAGMSGLDIDTRTDIYSLGVLLYELLTGTTPFDKERLKQAAYDEMRRIIREEEPQKPSTRISTTDAAPSIAACRHTEPAKLAKLVRGDLDWIVMKALDKDRNRRYETPNGFAQDVQRYLADEPVQAGPPSVSYRLRKFVRRNKGRVLAACLVSMAAFGGLIGAAYGSIEARNKRQLAELYERAVDARKEAEQARDGESSARREAQAAREKLAGEEYGRTMQIAYQECLDNNVPAALALLDRTRPEFRSWEWWYVHRLCHSEILKLNPVADGVVGTIFSTAFSPDGARVVISFANYATVMDAAAGTTLLILKGHTAGVKSVRFNRQGTRIVTGSYDGTAKVWDAATGAELLTFKGHGSVLSVSFSPDGTHVLSAGDDNRAKVWDAKTGIVIVSCEGHTSQINAAAISPDGTRIVTASEDETAIIWDARTGDRLQTLKGHTNSLTSASFCPDGSRVVTGSYDRTARVWDAETGAWLLTFHGHTDDVFAAAFSPDGSRIVTGSWDLTARVWDVKSGGEILTLAGHTDGVTSASFSPDGTRILTGCHGLDAKVWDAERKAGGLTFRGHTYCVHSAAVSPDGLRVVSMGLDTAANLEDLPETMKVWDARTGVVTATYKGDATGFQAAAFSPKGTRIVTACGDRTARVWDSRTGAEVLSLKGHTDRVTGAAFSPEGARIVTWSADRTARLWDAETGVELLVFRGHTHGVQSAAFSQDSARVVSTEKGTARVWDPKSGVEIATLTHKAVTSAAFSPDGTRVVTACFDGTARVWDIRTRAEVLALNGHTNGLRWAVFSPDGARILTGSEDRTARLWDAKTGAEVLALKGHTHGIDSAVFSPDGVRIVTAGFSAVQVWDPSPPPKPQGTLPGVTD